MPSVESVLIAIQHTTVYSVALIFFAAYPVITSLMWVTTSLVFVFRWERGAKDLAPGTSREYVPMVTVLIPAHNEEAVVARSLAAPVSEPRPRWPSSRSTSSPAGPRTRRDC